MPSSPKAQAPVSPRPGLFTPAVADVAGRFDIFDQISQPKRRSNRVAENAQDCQFCEQMLMLVNAGKTIHQKKGELDPPACSPVASCSFSLLSARNSLVSRLSERGKYRAIINHTHNKLGTLRKRHTTSVAANYVPELEQKNRHLTGKVRCLRSALRACAGRESRRITGNVTRRGD